jgi:putative aminopeptidase
MRTAGCHTVQSTFRPNSLKTNGGHRCRVTHNFTTHRRSLECIGVVTKPQISRFLAILCLLLVALYAHPAAAQLSEFEYPPSVSGYENELSARIRNALTVLHPAVDNLGDVIVTIGSGAPHRLIVTPIDEPGFVVSGLTADGYLRLQRLPQTGFPPIFNELYSAQPVKIRATNGSWIDGVVAGISVHLHRTGETLLSARDIDNMYVDIGATSPAEARKFGVDVLCPVVINRRFVDLNGSKMVGAAVGDKFGAAAVLELLQDLDPGKVGGTLTVAFIVQQRVGGRGLGRILSSAKPDEMVYVGRLQPGGNVPGMEGVHRAPRRELGSGVLVGLDKSSGELSGLAGDLKKLADENKIPIATDYSANIVLASYTDPPAFPARWAHIGIATVWPDTPAEMVSTDDEDALLRLLKSYTAAAKSSPGDTMGWGHGEGAGSSSSYDQLLETLIGTYGASNHEGPVRAAISRLLPKWAKPETDDAGNLILHVGIAPAGAKTPKILVVAHMDEIGFSVKSIASDGRLVVETLGGMDLSFYEGHPMLVHASTSERDGVMELPNGWDEQNFKWPAESDQIIRVDVGARNADEVAKLGIKVGDSVTIPKQYRPLLGTRANGRSFDDRVGDTALISAVWALDGPLKDRDVTFVWSTGEELGLIGAGALAKRLAAEGHTPNYVFAIDTLVSSDSPLESKRFGDAEIGKGFAIRAVDNSNITPRDLVAKVEKLARAHQIPYQLAVTGGGNDGATFVPFGAVDIALGWPLRYSHSPAEVIDTRDVDALARIVAVIARSW